MGGTHHQERQERGSRGPFSLTSITGEVMEQILETMSKYIKDKKVMGTSQHGFMKSKLHPLDSLL